MLNKTPLSTLMELLERRTRSTWVLLAVTMTFLGLSYSIILGPELPYPDENEYYQIAGHILAGQGFSLDGVTPTAYRPPGYPIFLLLPLSIDDSVYTARLLNFMLLIASMGLLHALVRRYASVQAAWFTVLLILLYPVLFYTAGTLYPQTLALFLITLISWVVLARDESWLMTVATGTLLGFLTLVSPTCLFLLPIVFIAAPVFGGWRWRSSVLAGLCAVAVIGSWSVRNQLVLGEPIFISTNISSILESTYLPEMAKDSATDLRAAPDGPAPEARDTQAGKLLQTLRSLMRNPGDYFGKLVNFFHFHNQMVVATEQSLLKDIVMFISYYSILALAAGRFLLRARIPLSRLDWWIALIYVSAAGFQALAYTRIRYRLPMDFLMAGMAGVTLQWILQQLGALNRSTDGSFPDRNS